MDSSLEALERKGNLRHALGLYNPLGAAETVVHFTPYPSDVRYAAEFETRRVRIAPFFNGRPKSTIAGLLALPRAVITVVTTMRRERISLVRGRLPYFGSFIGCLAARLLGIPSVVSLGGDNRLPQRREGRYYFGSRWISFGIETLVLRMCTVIIVPNLFTRDYVTRLIGSRASSRKVTVIPWILERALEPPALATSTELATLGLEPDVPIALIVGHLNRYKYASEMFEVTARILGGRGGAQFVFCGDGPLREEGERRLAGLPGAHLLGWQPNDRVARLMARAAIVLIPVSGFVLLEAAWLGRPVIASDVEWHGEMVVDDVTGWLARAGDVEGWVERIGWVLDHPDVAASAGEHLQERFRAEYAPNIAFGRELALYERLLSGVPSSARMSGAGA